MPLPTITRNGTQSKKAYLNQLCHFIEEYNSHEQYLDRLEKIEILFQIMLRAGVWLTHKPIGVTPKYANRYPEMLALAQAVGSALQALGVKPLVGDFSNISNQDRNYWLELLDVHHRAGRFLSERWDDWQRNAVANWKTQRKTFFEWLDGEFPKSADASLAIATQPFYRVGSWGKVEGYSVQRPPVYRHEVFIQEQSLQDLSGHAVSTQGFRSGPDNDDNSMGPGWGIFCYTAQGQLFLGSSDRDKFHHPSLVAGRPVIAAGEMVVNNGRVRGITNVSGHYKTATNEFIRFLLRAYWIPNDAIIWPRIDRFAQPFTLAEARSGADASQLDFDRVVATIPAWARTDLGGYRRRTAALLAPPPVAAAPAGGPPNSASNHGRHIGT